MVQQLAAAVILVLLAATEFTTALEMPSSAQLGVLPARKLLRQSRLKAAAQDSPTAVAGSKGAASDALPVPKPASAASSFATLKPESPVAAEKADIKAATDAGPKSDAAPVPPPTPAGKQPPAKEEPANNAPTPGSSGKPPTAQAPAAPAAKPAAETPGNAATPQEALAPARPELKAPPPSTSATGEAAPANQATNTVAGLSPAASSPGAEAQGKPAAAGSKVADAAASGPVGASKLPIVGPPQAGPGGYSDCIWEGKERKAHGQMVGDYQCCNGAFIKRGCGVAAPNNKAAK